MNHFWLDSMPRELGKILMEDLLQSSFVGINITDGEGRVLFLNETHRKITGHDPKLYLGRTMKEIAEDNLISESATQLALEKKNRYLLIKYLPTKINIFK